MEDENQRKVIRIDARDMASKCLSSSYKIIQKGIGKGAQR